MKRQIRPYYFDLIELIISALIAFALILDQKLVVYLITALGLNTILSIIKSGINKPNVKFFIFSIFIGLYVFGLLFTSDLSEGWIDLETKMSFVILPLFYGLRKRENKIDKSVVIWSLVAGVLTYTLHAYYLADICYNLERTRLCLEGSRLSNGIHPTYLALFIIPSIVFIIIDLFQTKKLRIMKIIAAVLIVPFFAYFTYKLYSIGPWVGVITVIFTSFLMLFFQLKKLWIFFGTITVLSFGGFLMITNLDLLASDYNTIKKEIADYFENEEEYLKENENNLNSVSARIVLWNTAVDFIQEHPFGVGTGDANQELYDFYQEKGMVKYAQRQLNPHSQYLQTGIALGFVGALFLIFAFAYYFRLAFVHRNYYLMGLVSFFGSVCFVESLFERQLGILFFMFFLMIFVSDIDSKSNNKINSIN